MKNLCLLVIVVFGSQENLNQNNHLNQIERKVISEDNNIINNIVEKQNLITNSYYRFTKILICMFACLVFFYFIYLVFKKSQLKTQEDQGSKQQAEEAKTEIEEEANEQQTKYFLEIKEDDAICLLKKEQGVILSVEDDSFKNLFFYSEWKDLFKKFFDSKILTIEHGRKIIEIDYNKIYDFAKTSYFCFFCNFEIIYFDNGKIETIFIINLDTKKEQIKNLNEFFLDLDIFISLVSFFSEQISSEMEKKLKNINEVKPTNINDFIIDIIKKFPTINDIRLLEIKYGFFSQSITDLNMFFLHKGKTQSFSFSFGKLVSNFFSHIEKQYGKSFLIKTDENLNQNNKIPIEVTNQNIALAKERLKNLCVLYTEKEDYKCCTVDKDSEIAEKKYKQMIPIQEQKIKQYLQNQYSGNQTYYLSWDDIIDFLEHCL